MSPTWRPAMTMGDTDLRWTDWDGATALFTTDAETCGEEDAIAVMAIPHDAGSGGVYLTPSDAYALIAFLQAALAAGGSADEQ